MSNGINTIQAANNGITSITKLVQSAQALDQPGAADLRHHDSREPRHAVRCDPHPDRPARRRLGLQRHQPARAPTAPTSRSPSTKPAPRASPSTAVDFTSAGAGDRRRGQQLGRRRRHHRGLDRPDRRADHAAFAVAGVRLEPVDRADPPGLHQGDDQHAADRRGRLTLADSNEEGANLLALQTRQQLSTTALSLASQASQSRAPPVRLVRATSTIETAARKVPPFVFCATSRGHRD